MDQPSWVNCLDRIRSNDQRASDEFQRMFLPGMRYFLCRQLGPQNLDREMHHSLGIVIEAIGSGDLREPEKLGFARLVVRRQISDQTDNTVRQREANAGDHVPLHDCRTSPETPTVVRGEEDIAVCVLKKLPRPDRGVLSRLYLQEQSEEQICSALQLTEPKFQLLKSSARFRFDELRNRMLARRNLSFVPKRQCAAA